MSTSSAPTLHAAYPRPDFDRSHTWQPLDGVWDFCPDPEDVGLNEGWYLPNRLPDVQSINIPFAWETPRSGINRLWLPVGWYRKNVQAPSEWHNLRVILHFGAVHYRCNVWISQRPVGDHEGGYLPFSFDITDYLIEQNAEIVIRVEAPLDKRSIPHGKQRSMPPDDYNDCAFTASSGIWQSVWLEARPATYIEHINIKPTKNLRNVHISVGLAGPSANDSRLIVQLGDEPVVRQLTQEAMSVSLDIPIAEPKLWSPESPNLYPICLELHSADGVDRVNTYTGLRTIEVRDEHLYLNGERLFFRGALDQGYWPETGYTAPDDNALHKDVLLALDAGYNLIRKHIKLEDPRWLYWADREGLLVWAEPPCIGRYSQEAVARFEAQLKPMVERDGSHPCIILWGIYNEEWGLDWRCAEVPEYQEAVERAYDLLSVLDPERPIIDNSGWWHVKTDVVDWHYYDEDMVTWKSITAAIAGDRSAVFGHRLSDTRWYETRLSIDDRDHSRLPLVNGEYGGGRPSNQGWLFRWQTQDLRLYDVFDGYIYTELYDVEHEIVGIYTADRILKDLGCIPAAINSDTLIIFDITPIAPGVDMVQADGVFQIPIRISHHAASKLHTRLCWGWQPGQMSGSVSVNAEPYATSPAMVINVELPFELTMARLYMWLEGYELCANVIDLARNHSS